MVDDREQALSLAFMRGHPVQAARVLEAMPAAQAAAMFERTPARLGSGVLAAMLPRQAANCLAEVADERALELLAPMSTQTTVTILRYLPEPRRRVLIAGLPTAAAMVSTLLLGYAEESLGAWADPDVVMLPAEARASDAIEHLRQTTVVHPMLFVTGAERRLSGVVGLPALLQAPGAATLGTLMRRPGAVLLAHAPLSATPAHPGWEEASTLPVVEAGERLVGVLTRDALARALRRFAPLPAVAAGGALPVLATRAYWLALSGLVESALALLPRVPAVLEIPDER